MWRTMGNEDAAPNDTDDRAAANHPPIIQDRNRRSGPSGGYATLLPELPPLLCELRPASLTDGNREPIERNGHAICELFTASGTVR